MRPEKTNPFLVLIVVLLTGCLLMQRDKPRSDARADSPWSGSTPINTAGVLSSNAATAVRIFGANDSTQPQKVYLAGLVANNTDTSAHTFTLISHVSGRVMWQCTLPANGGVILDSTQLLATDATVTTATTVHLEELAFTSDTTASNKIGVTASGYLK